MADVLALTPVQAGIMYHYLLAPGDGSYCNQLCLEVSGELDLFYFEATWNRVVAQNEMLRTVFRWEKMENPSQIVLKECPVDITFYDLSMEDAGEGYATRLEEIKAKDRQEAFDLTRTPFRILLCKRTNTLFHLIISNHHILYDGWSNGIIFKEFFHAYHDLSGGREPVLAVKRAFKEFIKWLHQQDKS